MGNFYRKLAIERCQYNMAQLLAVLHVGSGLENTSPAGQTVQALIEILNRDLLILRDLAEENHQAPADEIAGDL